METKISSGKIINAIIYPEFLNRNIMEHKALAIPKTNQNKIVAANRNHAYFNGSI